MSGVNKVILLGFLGKDPEVKFLDGGRSVCNFSMATNESWKDKDGKKQERVEWHRIQVWGKLGEACGEYLKKGRQCYVEGRIQTRKWTDKNDVERWATDIVAHTVVFLSGKDEGSESSGSSRPSEPPTMNDDDLPF